MEVQCLTPDRDNDQLGVHLSDGGYSLIDDSDEADVDFRDRGAEESPYSGEADWLQLWWHLDGGFAT